MNDEVINAAREIGTALNRAITEMQEGESRIELLSMDLLNCNNNGDKFISIFKEWVFQHKVQLPPCADDFISAVRCGQVSGQNASDIIRFFSCCIK